MSIEENITDIAAEETQERILRSIFLTIQKILKRQQEKLDQIAKTFKSGFTGVTQTLVDIFKQRNRTPASSNEGPPAKRIRPQTSTDTRAKLRRPLQAILYHKFNVNPRLCLVECAKLYIEIRKKLVSPEIKQFLVTYAKPSKAASNDTISRWIKNTISSADIDINVFKAYLTRSA